MTQILPQPLVELIEAFELLPGVGPRTAERYAYYLLRSDHASASRLSDNLKSLHRKIKNCPITFALIDTSQDVSPIYSNPSRDKKTVAVVADPFDIVAIEKTGRYKGTYHVLGGLVSPIDNIGPEQLHIAELISRIDDDNVTELILATNASVEGESTAHLITSMLENKSIKITRLARGLPVGLDLEYADQITLTRALEGRQVI